MHATVVNLSGQKFFQQHQFPSFDGRSGFTGLGTFFVHVTVTNVCVWLVKNLFWPVNQTCH